MTAQTRAGDVVVLAPEDYAVLGEQEFGVPGLVATEVIGPYARIQAVGPLIMLHEGVIEPHRGIGHHPHRANERLFYMLEGALDHDDALNGITGHMGPGDLGRLTEGRRGMVHKEWNNTDDTARAFILVYSTDPMPEGASFDALRDAQAPRYEEGPGVRTKELVGPRSPLRIHGDIRFFADTTLQAGAQLDVGLGEGEGAVLAPIEGQIAIGERRLGPNDRALVPPGEARSLVVRASTPARVLRVTFGPGYGFVVR
ncbi:MAG: pirin family protein [Actinomycetota bacterium]